MCVKAAFCNVTYNLICVSAGDDVSDAEDKSSHSQQEEDSDCPRDSGCFIPSECSDTKEDQVTDGVETWTCRMDKADIWKFCGSVGNSNKI